MEYLTLTYANIKQIMLDLKGIGAHHVSAGRHKGLTGKSHFQALQKAYDNYRYDNGLLPVTYELVYGHAWISEEKKSTTIPVEFQP